MIGLKSGRCITRPSHHKESRVFYVKEVLAGRDPRKREMRHHFPRLMTADKGHGPAHRHDQFTTTSNDTLAKKSKSIRAGNTAVRQPENSAGCSTLPHHRLYDHTAVRPYDCPPGTSSTHHTTLTRIMSHPVQLTVSISTSGISNRQSNRPASHQCLPFQRSRPATGAWTWWTCC